MTKRTADIYADMRNRARATGEVHDYGLVCRHFPNSGKCIWWEEGAPRDITNGLRKPEIFSLIDKNMGEDSDD